MTSQIRMSSSVANQGINNQQTLGFSVIYLF